MKSLQLFLTFLKIGAFTFGGGYAMIPLIEREAVDNKGWVTDDELLEVVAVAESTPGPIAINAATFVGYRVGGVIGAFFATLGVVLPSFIIICALSAVLDKFGGIRAVKYAFTGIRAAVVALILKALVTMYKKCKKSAVGYIATALSFVLTAVLEVPVVLVLVGCAVFGLVTSLAAKRRCEK